MLTYRLPSFLVFAALPWATTACVEPPGEEFSSGINLSDTDAMPSTTGATGASTSADAPDDGGDSSGDAPEGEPSCDPEPGLPEGFSHDLCSCEGLTVKGALFVGDEDTDTLSAGVNQVSDIIGAAYFKGDATLYGSADFKAGFAVTRDYGSAANLAFAGAGFVDRDLNVGGDVTGAGLLWVQGKAGIAGNVAVAGVPPFPGTYTAPDLPCGCTDMEIIDVPAEVAAAQAANDNDAIGLPTNVEAIGAASVTLPTGTYYLDSLDFTGALHFNVTGDVKLYVDSSVDIIGHEWIEIQPDASLELWVAGGVSTVGNAIFGNPSASGSFALYVGGENDLQVNVGNQIFFGSLYAPRSALHVIGNTWFYGSVFAKDIVTTGAFGVGGGINGGLVPPECEDPGTGSDGGDTDDGGPGPDPGPFPEG